MAKIKNVYKKNESSTKKSTKKNGKSKFKSVISFVKDERLHKSVGLLFILISFYLLIAFTSYLFTWKVDYNIIDGQSFSFVFSDDSIQVTNWLGKLGAYSAHKFLKVWFGISSYIFPFVFFIIGVRILFKVRLLPIVKSLKISVVLLVWLSICMGYFLVKVPWQTVC